jgi:hypothetical protein
MKTTVTCLFLVLLLACKKDEDTPAPDASKNEALVKGKLWLTVQRLKNGLPDPAFTNEISTYEFRADGKMYIIQEAPFMIRDTANYTFIDNNTIKITKPWVSHIVDIDCKIKKLDAARFEFTMTSIAYPDTYDYKMEVR